MKKLEKNLKVQKICCSLLVYLQGEKEEGVLELAELFFLYLESKGDLCEKCKYGRE